MELNLKAVVRRIGESFPGDLQRSPGGDLFVAQGMPPYTEAARKGQGWSVMTTAAVAGLVVRPTTVALGTLWNGENDSGKSYVMDRAFTHQLVSGAAETRFGIWLCMHDSNMPEPTADITAFAGNAGRQNYGGKAFFDVDATVIDDGWFPWGNSVSAEPTGVLPGAQATVDIGGRLIVPPGGGISIHVVASSVNEDFTAGFSWFEERLDIE